jgi:hypothetical protein
MPSGDRQKATLIPFAWMIATPLVVAFISVIAGVAMQSVWQAASGRPVLPFNANVFLVEAPASALLGLAIVAFGLLGHRFLGMPRIAWPWMATGVPLLSAYLNAQPAAVDVHVAAGLSWYPIFWDTIYIGVCIGVVALSAIWLVTWLRARTSPAGAAHSLA